MTASAADRTLSVPELLEAILVDLTITDVLRLQRVSRTWQDIITDSPKLQKKLWFRLDAVDSERATALNFTIETNPMFYVRQPPGSRRAFTEWYSAFHPPGISHGCMKFEAFNGIRPNNPVCFILVATDRKPILSLRETIPASAQRMYLLRSDKPVQITIDIHYEVFKEDEEPEEHSALLSGKQVDYKVSIGMTCKPRMLKLGEFLEICEELVQQQPTPEFPRKPNYIGGRHKFSQLRALTEKEVRELLPAVREHMMGRLPCYSFLKVEPKARSCGVLVTKAPQCMWAFWRVWHWTRQWF